MEPGREARIPMQFVERLLTGTALIVYVTGTNNSFPVAD
jgi:hypothetical protein